MIVMTQKLKEMMETLKISSAETYYHSIHVKYLTIKMIKMMNYFSLTNYNPYEVDCICKGALLHDLGKLSIENVTLTKPTTLSNEEWEGIRKHPAISYTMVENELSDFEREIIKNICLYHHERIDGSGYNGIVDIPMYVQIVSICDVFDALCSERAYKEGMPFTKALDMIDAGKAGTFDKKLCDCLRSVALELAE